MNSGRTFTPRSKGEWNGYVVSGKTREERKSRLDEVPEEWRDQVRKHVETFFAIKANFRRKHERNRTRGW